MAIARVSVVVDVLCRDLAPQDVPWGAQATRAVLDLQARFIPPIRPVAIPGCVDLDDLMLDLCTVEACLDDRNPYDHAAGREIAALETALQHLSRICRAGPGGAEA